MAQAPKKKVVRVEPSKKSVPTETGSGKAKRVWSPTPESKKKATNLRIVAWVAWILAIGLEITAVVLLLRRDEPKVGLLIVALVVMAALAVAGNLAWRKANRLDPASEKNKTRFFIQNQLGVFMTVLAFLPLVILVFADKNLDGKEKALVGGIGAVLLVGVAVLTGVEYDSASQELYAEEEQTIVLLTGEDIVYWTKSGKVFHVCAEVPDVNKESADGTIYEGTVADAHAAGKDRITKRWESEAINYCGYTQEDVDRVVSQLQTEGFNVEEETGSGETDTDEVDADQEDIDEEDEDQE